MIRNDGSKFINWPENVGKCYWALDHWKNKSMRGDIEKLLIEIEEEKYLEYIKKRG